MSLKDITIENLLKNNNNHNCWITNRQIIETKDITKILYLPDINIHYNMWSTTHATLIYA